MGDALTSCALLVTRARKKTKPLCSVCKSLIDVFTVQVYPIGTFRDGVVKTNDENTRLKKTPGVLFCSLRHASHCMRARQFNASDVDVARDYVWVRHRVWVWDDAAVPRRGVVRAMRGV